MIRIFQTGDNHIGLKYAGHEQAETLVAARINAFEGMVSTANKEGCNLFVITGDLFEKTSDISEKDIKTLLGMLSDFNGTVVVLPGNHDYYQKESELWQNFNKIARDMDNILLLTEYRPYPLNVGEDKVVLYPALCTSLHSEPGKNNLDWIKNENIVPDDTYRIGIAHGAVDGETIDNEGAYFRMTRSELESIPLDAWLIGHTHVPFPSDLTDEFSACDKILNAGTHVQTNVNNNTEGLCFIVEIDENKRVRAKKFHSGSIRFYRRSISLTANNMSEDLKRELADIDDNSVVDITLSGAVSIEEYDNRISIIENALSRFIEKTYDESSLSKLITKELIDAEFAETSISGKLITELLDQPKEAQLAYELLKSIKGDK
ncbi:MAG: metallophosphoesterase [Ruminococcus sp.]|nr:metallophosphoesterase [Ruminococcus sp.]